MQWPPLFWTECGILCSAVQKCSINDLFYDRLPIIINSYVAYTQFSRRNYTRSWLSWESLLGFWTAHLLYLATSWTTLFRYFACLHELVGFLVCLFSCCIMYCVYDLIINIFIILHTYLTLWHWIIGKPYLLTQFLAATRLDILLTHCSSPYSSELIMHGNDLVENSALKNRHPHTYCFLRPYIQYHVFLIFK